MEQYKDIPGYEGYYQVSNTGNVKSLNYKKLNYSKILSSGIDGSGYELVVLCKEKLRKSFKVHRLVALVFISNLENKPEVNHKNGIKTDNRVENLEWVSSSENHLHRYRILGNISVNKGKFLKYNSKSKKINQYDLEGNFIKTWDCIKEAGINLNIGNGNIVSCCKGRLKKTGGYIWKYFNS